MKLIELTNIFGGKVYINPSFIGHIYPVPEASHKIAHTRVGVSTHNNGGFEVKESIKEIQILIKNY
jgi:hypothetical protein